MSPRAIITLIVLVGIALLAIAAARAVDTYNAAILAVAEEREKVRLRDLTIATKNSVLAAKERKIKEVEASARRRAEAAAKAQEDLDERDRLIAELRRTNRTVDAFLAQPVPPELREHGGPAGGNGAGVRADHNAPPAPKGAPSH